MEEALCARFKLTRIEVDIFAQVVSGRSNTAIAQARRCSVGTVAKQIARMLRKFGVTTRRELRALLRRESGAGRFDQAPPARSAGSLRLLSHRERQVLVSVENGRSNKRIAAELGIAPSTVGVLLCRARAKVKTNDPYDARRTGEHGSGTLARAAAR